MLRVHVAPPAALRVPVYGAPPDTIVPSLQFTAQLTPIGNAPAETVIVPDCARTIGMHSGSNSDPGKNRTLTLLMGAAGDNRTAPSSATKAATAGKCEHERDHSYRGETGESASTNRSRAVCRSRALPPDRDTREARADEHDLTESDRAIVRAR
eukprot:3072077-Prymnesium_polylepis.2